MNYIDKCLMDTGYIRFYLSQLVEGSDTEVASNSIEEMLSDIDMVLESIRSDCINNEQKIAKLQKIIKSTNSEIDFTEYEASED